MSRSVVTLYFINSDVSISQRETIMSQPSLLYSPAAEYICIPESGDYPSVLAVSSVSQTSLYILTTKGF